MPLISVRQSAFTGGEFAPSLYQRTDLAKYASAVRKMLNAYPRTHGPVDNRGGTGYIGEVKDSTKVARLIPFQFSVEQGYHLVFEDQNIRIVKDAGLVINAPGNGTDIRVGAYTWSLSGSGTSEYYLLDSGGDPGLDEPEEVYEDPAGTPVTLTKGALGSLSAAYWAYGDNDSLGFDTIYVRLTDSADPDSKASGFVEAAYIYDVVTPYLEADLPLLKYTQSADVLYITHPSYSPRKLSRTAHDVWTLSTITFGASISAPTGLTRASGSGTGNSYVVTAINVNGEESVASSAVTGGPGDAFTWNTVTGAEYYYFYKDSNGSGTYGWIGQAENEAFTEPAGGIIPDFEKTPPIVQNPFSGANDYPGVPEFFEQRLNYARTNNQPQTIWGSVVGSFDNLNISYPSRDDDAYNFTINAREVNEIRWLVSTTELLIGTSGSEWVMSSGGDTNTVTPTSVNIKLQSQWGSSQVRPLVIGSTVLFIGREGNIIRDFSYSFEADRYQGNDLTILARHLFDGYVLKDWAYQQTPDSIIWCIRSDGYLLGLTYQRAQQIWSWHRHNTNGYFESVSVIRKDDESDEVVFIVKRSINGVNKRYIEYFRCRLPVNTYNMVDIQDAYFVDCGLTYDAPVDITAATSANPVVVTAAAHGITDGEYVDNNEVLGMTEINTRFRVHVVDANNVQLEQQEPLSIRSSVYKWTVSGSGTNEYYVDLVAGGDPSLDAPTNVYENSDAMTIGTAGSLSAGEWDYGDNDSLGFDTIYVRLTDNTDPDVKVNGYLKAGLSVNGSAYAAYISGGKLRKCVTSIVGFDHLEGEEVSVLANGNVISGKSISSGVLTLDNCASRVHVGLGYVSDLETLDFDVQTAEGGAIQDKIRTIPITLLSLENTRALYVGPNEDDLIAVPFREDEAYDEATAPFTGDKEVDVYAPDHREGKLLLRNYDPVPFTISSIVARVDVGED